MKIKKVLIILIILLSMSIYYNSMNLIRINENNESFHENILSNSYGENIIDLNQLTTFEWDKVYFFDPYQSINDIYNTLGFKYYGLKQQTHENAMQIIFVNNNKVICYCHGDGKNNGFFINGNIEYESRILDNNNETLLLYDSELSEKLGYIYLQVV